MEFEGRYNIEDLRRFSFLLSLMKHQKEKIEVRTKRIRTVIGSFLVVMGSFLIFWTLLSKFIFR